MKIILLPVFFFVSLCAGAQGRYAGPLLKKIINTSFTDTKKIPALKGYEFREGSVVSDIKDPKTITVDVFQKGIIAIVFFSLETDTAKKIYTILDVLEVRNVMKGWEVRTALCRMNKKEDTNIIALAKQSKKEDDYLTEIKQAWRFDRNKKLLEAIPVKGVDCFNEGGD